MVARNPASTELPASRTSCSRHCRPMSSPRSKADVARHGILVAVELDEHGELLDWSSPHPSLARAAGRRHTRPGFPRVIRAGMSEFEKRAHVRAVNLVRRHLNAAQRRAIIADALRDDTSQSDRQVAVQLGVSHPTVAAVRRELERAGDVEEFPTRSDVLGRKQPVRRPSISVTSGRDESLLWRHWQPLVTMRPDGR